MPWSSATVENERARFVIEAELSDLSHSELCLRCGISRPTGHKWIERYEAEGLSGLQDRSHAPRTCPHASSPKVVDRVLEIRDLRGWGARKIRQKLLEDPEIEGVPSVDTVNRILRRNGRIEPRKPRRRRTHPGTPLPISSEPNSTWTADFKGEFRTGDHNLCFPLTVQDGGSRFLLACQGMLRLNLAATMRRFRHLFGEFGWISLGIVPERIEPGKPQQNGRHERMHRTLKAKTASPPRANLRAHQRQFNQFRRVYNFERPHEALGVETPSAIYRPSSRPFTEGRDPLEYPGHYELRRVSGDATVRWKSRKIFVSTLLRGRDVGLEQVGDGVWSVYFGPLQLGWLDEVDYRIMDVKKRSRRRR